MPLLLAFAGLLWQIIGCENITAAKRQVSFFALAFLLGLLVLVLSQSVTAANVARNPFFSSIACYIIFVALIMTRADPFGRGNVLGDSLLLYSLVTFEFVTADLVTLPGQVALDTRVAIIGGAGMADGIFIFPLAATIAFVLLFELYSRKLRVGPRLKIIRETGSKV